MVSAKSIRLYGHAFGILAAALISLLIFETLHSGHAAGFFSIYFAAFVLSLIAGRFGSRWWFAASGLLAAYIAVIWFLVFMFQNKL
jgi:hypothetical protein